MAAGSLGLALMLIAVLTWVVALLSHAAVIGTGMPAGQSPDAYGAWFPLVNYYIAAGVVGLACCLAASVLGHIASVEIRQSRGWLSGEGTARLAQILGLAGLVALLVTFCSTASLLAYRFWVLPN